MSGTPVSRQSSLENNLFAGARSDQDPEAARAIALLAAELQSVTATPGQGQAFPSTGLSANAQRPTLQPTLQTKVPDTKPRSLITFLEALKPRLSEDKVKPLTELILQYNANKIPQEQLFKILPQTIGKELAYEVIQLGLKEGIIKMAQVPVQQSIPTTTVKLTPEQIKQQQAILFQQQQKQQEIDKKLRQGGTVQAPPTTAQPRPPTNPQMANQMRIPQGQIPTNAMTASQSAVQMMQPGVVPNVPPGAFFPSNMAKEAYLRKVQQLKAQTMLPMPTTMTPEQQKNFMLQQYLQKTPGVVSMMPGMIPTGQLAPGMVSPVSMQSVIQKTHQPDLSKKTEETDDKKASIKDLTDVTRLAGIDVKLESAQILGDQEDEIKYQSETTEPTLLNTTLLKKKMQECVKGSVGINDDVVAYVALATQEHLRGILQQLVAISQQRQDSLKEEFPTKITTDTRRQLKLIEAREREEDKKRRFAGVDRDESKRAKLLPTSQEEMQRNNTAALQAAGNVRVTPKLVQQPVFTQQHLIQLQQLQSMQDKGIKLDPTQLQKYQYLRAGLQKLHQYQQQQSLLKTKTEPGSVVPTVPPPVESTQKKVILEDVLFSQKFGGCRTVLWKSKQKTARWLL